MPWGKPDIFIAEPLPKATGWGNWVAPEPIKPSWADNEEMKKLFGVELAKQHPSPFVAACEVFKDDTSGALWASINWITDPIVIGARDAYTKTVQLNQPLLDKFQLAAKVLSFADECTPEGRYAVDAKERLAALIYYGKLQGYTDTVSPINFTHNQLTVKVVKSENQEKEESKVSDENIIDVVPDDIPDPVPIKLRIVK